MPKMDLIFVSSGRHPTTEGLIRKATGSKYAHAALGIDVEGRYWVVEAVRPAVRFSPGNIFKDAPELQTIQVEITEAQRQAVVTLALWMAGQPYGIDDCIIGGANDVLGEKAAQMFDRFINNDQSFNCSGLQSLLVREAFPGYMSDANFSMITPEAARKYAQEYFKET